MKHLPSALALLGAAILGHPRPACAETARTTDNFVDAIGYCLHVQNYDDPSWLSIKADLGSVGVRFVRDGLEHFDNPTYKNRLQSLYDSYGIKILAVCTPYGNNQLQDPANVPPRVEAIKPILLALEGPNEPDIFWYDGWNMGGFTNRYDQLAWYHNSVYDRIKAYAPTSSVLVTTPALAFGETAELIRGKGIKHDILAWHHYNGQWKPNPWQLPYSRERYPSSKPAYLTEHGRNVNAHVTLKGQMKYDTRSLAHFFEEGDGNQKTFLYVFGPDAEDFGTHNSIGNQRPGFRSVKNLIATLKEATWNTSSKTWNRPNFTPGNLDYSFTGDTSDLRTRLLQKSNGEFYLLAWLDVDSAGPNRVDYDTQRTLGLALGTPCGIVQYDFSDNGDLTNATLAAQASSASLVVRDRITILKLTPGGGRIAGEYFDNANFTGTKVTRNDANIDFDWGSGSPVAGISQDSFSIRWQARLAARGAGTYTFYITGDDGFEVWLNNAAKLGNAWRDQGPSTYTFNQTLGANEVVDFRMEFYENGGGAMARVEWSGPGFARQVIPAAQFSAPGSGTAIVDGAIYELEPQHAPGMRLDVSGAFDVDSANVQIWTDNNSSAQSWRMLLQGDGTYELVPQCATGRRLDVYGGTDANGADVKIWTDNNTPSQRWTILEVSTGLFELTPGCAPSRRMDCAGAGTGNQTDVHIWAATGGLNQRWRLFRQ